MSKLAAYLTQHEVPWNTWNGVGEVRTIRDFAELINRKEIRLLVESLGGKEIVVMDSTVIAVRIYCELPAVAPRTLRLILVEYKQKADGRWYPRIKNEGSLSGRIREGESELDAFIREVSEELSFELTEAELATFQLSSDPFEPDMEPSSRFPGVYSRKRIRRASWRMPPRRYKSLYLEREGKGTRSKVKGALRWWPMSNWIILDLPPPPVDTLRQLERL